MKKIMLPILLLLSLFDFAQVGGIKFSQLPVKRGVITSQMRVAVLDSGITKMVPVDSLVGYLSSGDSCIISCGNINTYAWLRSGNVGTNTGEDFMGTRDSVPLIISVGPPFMGSGSSMIYLQSNIGSSSGELYTWQPNPYYDIQTYLDFNSEFAQLTTTNNNGDTGMHITETPTEVIIASQQPQGLFEVDASVRINDGTQGTNKVFTSDANGYGSWQTSSGSGWALTGNAGTNSSTNFIGTTDNQGLSVRTNDTLRGGWLNDGSFLSLAASGMLFGLGNLSIIGQTDSSAFLGSSAINMIVHNNVNNPAINFTTNSAGSINFEPYVTVTGKLKYQDGSQSNGKVLTSDSAGIGSWQPITQTGATGSEPSSPHLGQFYFDTTLTKMKFWNGSVWAQINSTP